MIIRYNKLVRDRIPEIIKASGKKCTTEALSQDEYLRMLDAKLDEELAEYHRDQNLEELADLLEVIRAVTVARGYSLVQIVLKRIYHSLLTARWRVSPNLKMCFFIGHKCRN